jgi:hypothetical protein
MGLFMVDVYENLKEKMFKISRDQKLLSEPVTVRARVLTTEEAIGNPEADDFPLQEGKERLMQAEFHGAMGQAFTDQYGDFEGLLKDVFEMRLENNFRRAVFVSTVSAVLRHLGRIEKTIHCRNKEPTECAVDLDQDNIGTKKYGVTIEGPEHTDDSVDWADLLAVTGTTLVNGAIGSFLKEKPFFFYGTTIAGAAHLMDWELFCARSH